MFSNFDCYKFQTNPIGHKETKFQRYLRERNEKILEKCFNIKIVKESVNKNEPTKEVRQTSNEKLLGQPSSLEPYQQNFENSLIMPVKNKDENSQSKKLVQNQISDKAENTKSTGKDSMQSSKTKIYNKKKSNTLQFLSNTKNSSNSSGSKTYRTIQSARSNSSPNWKSPFNSFTTTGQRPRSKRDQYQSSEFSYTLSPDEQKFVGQFRSPMKSATEAERQLLQSGQRKEYLVQRYKHSPVVKYNFPEATSWRIGWLQQQQ